MARTDILLHILKQTQTSPVYLFSAIWSQVEPGQPDRKTQRASFLQVPPSYQTYK